MPVTYPPAAPTLAGDTLSISRFLQSPTMLNRRLRTIAENRFISDVLLTGRYTLSGGAVLYEQSESIFTDRTVEAVNAGSEYPMSGIPTGTAAIAEAKKWGQDTWVTDESIKRRLMDPVNRGLVKLVNSVVSKVDSVAMSAISSAVSKTDAAGAAWTGGQSSSGDPTADILDAIATIRALDEGYELDTLVLTDSDYAALMTNKVIAAVRAREDKSNPVYTGEIPVVAGLRVLTSPHATAHTALLLDSTLLGGMADEDLGGPGYSGQVKGVQGKTIREDKEDRWRLRARRVTVPVIIEPNAAFEITAISS